ncbi:MAG: hypothetical protein K1X55_04790 [Chitinophagales bacterium]|nr:hypothetical protein [Chitinophagales bacterium]
MYTFSKYILFLLTLVGWTSLMSQEQPSFATPSYKGILIILGKEMPTAPQTYTIERKESGTDKWTKIASTNMQEDMSTFLKLLEINRKLYPDYYCPTDIDIRKNWAKFTTTTHIDSLRFIGQSIPVQLTCGTMYYDQTAKENTQYEYRVTFSGRTSFTKTSKAVKFPYHPVFDSITFQYSTFTTNGGLALRWKSVGKGNPETFRLYRYVNEKPVALLAIKDIFQRGDTTFYSAIDTTAKSGYKYQYAIFPYDKYGNHGKTSAIGTAYAFDFKSIYFKSVDANTHEQELAIDLKWQLSSTVPVEHIDIYRSINADKNFVKIAATIGSDNSYRDKNIQADKVYYYYLVAHEFYSGDTLKSTRFFDNGWSKNKGLAPIIQNIQPDKSGVKLEVYIPEQGNSHLLVYRREQATQPFVTIAEISIPDTSKITFLDTTANLPQALYEYKVAVKSKSFIVSDTSTAAFSGTSTVAIPNGVLYLSAYFQDNAVNLRWEEDSSQTDIVAYLVKRREINSTGKPIGSFTVVNKWDNTAEVTNFYTDKSFISGKTYEYMVCAVNDKLLESKENPTALVAIPAIQLPTPTALSARATNEGIVLEWAKVNDPQVTKYKIYRYQRGQEPVLLNTVTSPTYLDKTAKKGELYFYYLTSEGEQVKESTPSAEVGIRY